MNSAAFCEFSSGRVPSYALPTLLNMNKKFSTKEDEMLIELVREHPPLYQVKSKSYKDSEVKNNIWKIIAEKLGKSEADCKGRWKNIKDYYQKKRKFSEKGTGSAADGHNFFKKFKSLTFLENSTSMERQSKSNSCDTQNVSQDVTAEDADNSESKTTAEIRNEEDETSKPREEIEINRKRRHAKGGTNQILQEIRKSHFTSQHKCTNISIGDDPAISMFFNSIASTVTRFPPHLKVRAKIKVMHIISKKIF